MMIERYLLACLAAALLTLGCDDTEGPVGDDDDDDSSSQQQLDPIEAAPLSAGSADGTLDLPVGLPLAGFTGRAGFFGAQPVDGRDSAYTVEFVPSNGVHTRIPMHVVWLQAGDQNAVLVNIQLTYAFDGLVVGLEEAIREATGVDVTDQVLLFTGHSHHAYGDFSQAHHLFLGHDRYNKEIFLRLVAQATTLAEQAHGALQPAAIGVGLDPNFDPLDEIYRSRREDHHGLVDAFGEVVEDGYKDPNLYLVRVDASQGTADAGDDEPLALLFGFGIHGTIMGEDNALVSSEAPGAIELKLRDQFDEPVTVMHFQVHGGDMSPAGTQGDFARMESIGELAAPRVLELWDATETTTEPVVLEALARTVPLGRDIRVERNGEVDLHYLEYDEDYEPDLLVFDEYGVSLNPYDEFTAPYGAGLCGDPDMEIPFVSMNVLVPPYSSCAMVDLVAALFPILFYTDLYYEMEFPLWETRSTMIGALGIDSVPFTTLGGGTETDRFVAGFFPGEVNTLLGRMFQKRIADEQGVDNAFLVGEAMDHEGYVLSVEDWMRGGYEASINLWGPLQGEYTLERMLELTSLLGNEYAEDPALPAYMDQEYPEWPLEVAVPDLAPGCGTVPDTVYEDLWTRDGWQPVQPQPDDQVRRVADVAHFLFLGGDPVIDLPSVTLQMEQTPGGGDFADVLLPNGAPLDDRGYDMIVSYSPDPLVELYEEEDRHHYWLVEWQAVTDRPSLDHMAGMPAGAYRFAARGLCTDASDTEFPFDGLPYEVFSDPFDVTGDGVLEVTATHDTWGEVDLMVAYAAAARGFRLLSMTSDYRTATHLVGGDGDAEVTVDVLDASGLGDPLQTFTGLVAALDGDHSDVEVDLSGMPQSDYVLRVTDTFGNTGTVAVAAP